MKDYDFTDCLFVDLNIDKIFSKMEIVLEAFYPFRKNIGKRTKGLIKLMIQDIKDANLTKSHEFDIDINRIYNFEGEDYRANEIYSVDIIIDELKYYNLTLKSDFIMINLSARDITILEI